MNHPRQQLLQIQRIVTRVLDNWPDFETTCAVLTSANSDRLGVHGGNISDPVYAAQVNHATWDETAAHITEALGILKIVDRDTADIAIQHPVTASNIDAATRAARCADPTCDDNAVSADGLCFPHWNAGRRTAHG